MSFLSILLFTSSFYFAYGNPDASTTDQSSSGNYSSAPFDFESPYIEDSQFKAQIESFMAAMSDALDKYLSAMMTQMDNENQEPLRTMAIDGCLSYVNSMILMGKEQHVDNGTISNGTTKYSEGKNDDIMLEFLAMDPLDEKSGFIPTQDATSSSASEAKTEVVNDGKENATIATSEAEAQGSQFQPN